MKKIVISAVNLTEGGVLSILNECLEYVSGNLLDSYEIIALVNDDRQLKHKGIKFYSFPWAKKSWLARLYYEYVYSLFLSKKLKPYLWFSLHDITPNVVSDVRAVYCHNPSPFHKISFRDICLDFKFALFNFFYRYLYAVNIAKNDFVIVQQNVLRDKFRHFFKKIGKIVVAYPRIDPKVRIVPVDQEKNIFFYPAFPRVCKNFEVICNAAKILLQQGIHNFQVIFTISGNENRYSKHLYSLFGDIENIKFCGYQSREDLLQLYNKARCVIFPSKLETWGVTISEAKYFSRPIFLADLDYAHETIGKYDKVKFFDPEDPAQLALTMKDMICGEVAFQATDGVCVASPFARNWKELFDILLSGQDKKRKI